MRVMLSIPERCVNEGRILCDWEKVDEFEPGAQIVRLKIAERTLWIYAQPGWIFEVSPDKP